MAKKRRRRSTRRNEPRTRIVYRNKPRTHHRRRRTSYRRNPAIVATAMSLGTSALVGGASMLAGEATARLVAKRVFKKDPGSLAGGAIQAGTGLAAGIAVEMFGKGPMARQIAHDLVSGVAASLMRTALKQVAPGNAVITDALSDGGMRIIRPVDGVRRRQINGYVRADRQLNGYVNAQRAPMAGYQERVSKQLGYR